MVVHSSPTLHTEKEDALSLLFFLKWQLTRRVNVTRFASKRTANTTVKR